MRESGIKAFLEGLSPETRPRVLSLRAVIRGVAPGAEESILWGGLSYHRPEIGGRVKGAVCQIAVKDGVVRLDFIHGIRLADPAGLLRGDGVSKRHVTIETVADARRPEIASLIRDAAAIMWPLSEQVRGVQDISATREGVSRRRR